MIYQHYRAVVTPADGGTLLGDPAVTSDMAAVAIVDEPITFDHFMRTVLALREDKTDCSEDELFATACGLP